MGTYVNITDRRLTKKNVELNGDKVKVDFAPFSHKPSINYDNPPEIEKKMERAWNMPKDKQADYIVFGKPQEGDTVYKSNKKAIWSDGSGFWSGIHWEDDLVGTLKNNGRKWFIEPKELPIELR
tara:strand:+ start:2258 stop:2629 length:372 start_codon:yes stop_codon:yes gene_type:complete